MNRDELLAYLKDKISDSDYEELYLWTKSKEKRFLFYKTKFEVSLNHDKYEVEYTSTGAYFGDGYIETLKFQRI